MADLELADVPLQAPCAGCEWEPLGCPDSDARNVWGWGRCDGFGHDCSCWGIRQGLFTEFACESCYVEQK